MNVQPKGAPQAAPQTTQPSQSQMSAKERAIAILSKSNPIPVDANNVGAEDLSAVRAPQATQAPQDAPQAEVDAPKAAEPSEPPLSSQYAILARKEKAQRERERQFKQERQAFDSQKSELERLRAEAAQPKQTIDESKYIAKDRIANDTINALLEAGVSYDRITELMLNPPAQQDPQTKMMIGRLEAKIAELESKSGRIEKSYEEQQQTQYKQAVDQIRNEAKDLINGDPVNYEAIIATRSVADVVDLIEKTFKEDGVLLTVEQAAKEVEDYLAEEATKLSRLNKIQRRLNTGAQASAPKQEQKQPQQMKTLSNVTSSSGKLSAKERAILAFKGELKN